MGAGGRREKEAEEGGIDGKGAIAEDMRKVEGVRGTTEKRNGVRRYWEDMWGTKTWETTASGSRKGRGKSAGAFPSSPPASQGQFVAAQGSLGINRSSDTPLGDTRLVLNHSFQVTKDLPTSPQGAGDRHPQKRGYLAHPCNPLTNPDITPLWFIPTGSTRIGGQACTTSLSPQCPESLPASPTALATVPQPPCMRQEHERAGKQRTSIPDAGCDPRESRREQRKGTAPWLTGRCGEVSCTGHNDPCAEQQ